jgi:16S rRNA (cytidine1402-2'-O)-methyltransferase
MQEAKKQIFPPLLWVVGTPIGNLSDFSVRGKEALTQADWILCEDTRQTAKLLSFLGIGGLGRLKRLDAHTSEETMEAWLELLRDQKKFALVSDAGMPSISDPGAQWVALVRRSGIAVSVIPGPCAIVTLLAGSGFPETAFCFRGFFPRKPSCQEEEIRKSFQSPTSRVFVWFESPHRIVQTIAMIQKLQEECPVVQMVVAKELTKWYERFFVGSPEKLGIQVEEEMLSQGEVGEWCFALWFQPYEEVPEWKKALDCLYASGVSVSESSKWVSRIFEVSKKEVYPVALQLFKKRPLLERKN